MNTTQERKVIKNKAGLLPIAGSRFADAEVFNTRIALHLPSVTGMTGG
jgi:hypothetical protein